MLISHPVHSAPSHAFRTPYHSHSAPQDPACPVTRFRDCHRHCTHTRNSFSAFPFISLLFLTLLFIVDCCIPYRFYVKFFVSISVQLRSDHSMTCNGQAIAVSRPTPCHSHSAPPHPTCPVHIQFFLCFFLLILGLSYSSCLCIDCCIPYPF